MVIRVQNDARALIYRYAERGQFADLIALCRQAAQNGLQDLVVQREIGNLLSQYGFLRDARACYLQAQALSPADQTIRVNLANLARDAGDHAEARRLYVQLQQALPDHPIIRRNALTCLEYDPQVSDGERLRQAKAWGEWAIRRAGGGQRRPAMPILANRPLRIGYVSADLCQHTVGLFVRDVLKAHNTGHVQVFAYSAGQVKDWVTSEISAVCTLRDVAALDDAGLAAQIRQDGIDVLIDLSGHTAGSRLTAFAYRPAPVMVSWLGYFATTGLPYMDAVLLDEWHAPAGTEAQFVEPILRLPSGRFCYQPVPWAPVEVAPPPFLRNGYITFGCFNNTAKFNEGVFDVWALVLQAVPGSRLILKWRTFNDEAYRQKVTQAFVDRGIVADRIELRGPSFHADLLKEYADIDITLDPFPFTGGLTSCEALWMGVPVVTWQQSRVVSRQTYAFLNQIGLPELAAQDADDYVRIAVQLANDRETLAKLRAGLREKMRASSLMDVAGFTRQLENTLIDLYRRIEAEERESTVTPQTFLHIGCGPKRKDRTTRGFNTDSWKELRFDIDESVNPDLVGTMTDMSAVDDASVDAIFSSHNIEHLYPHEVPVALKEFLRVLKPHAFLVLTCPDLKSVCALVAEDKLTEAAYTSPAGPIAPIDILYGYRPAMENGNLFMAHRSGFTQKVLDGTLRSAGFQTIASAARGRAPFFDLWVVASKSTRNEDEMRALAREHFPQ